MRLECPSALVGFAALSVEMFTKCSTPTSIAAFSTFSVPSTFVFHASEGYCSSIGRCFSAAAWNTTSGRRSRNTRSRSSRSRISASTASRVSSSPWPKIEICVECSPDSSRSSMNSSLGPNLWICRHSSEPIDPPAPVTSTRLPER